MAMTLFERYGGFVAVRKVVSAFYDRVLDSERLAHHFEHADMRRLIDHQTRFVSYLLGGPASYSDDHLERMHRQLAITADEFDEVIDLLEETLEEFGFEDDDVATVLGELRTRERLIVARA